MGHLSFEGRSEGYRVQRVDELNSVLGLVRAWLTDDEIAALIEQMQTISLCAVLISQL
jgi:cob(I)alamin adenosyltransferase